MNSKELRQKFLDFFEKRGHKVIPSASLIPNKTDTTALFTTAGMQPLVPYLLGEKHPEGKRIVNVQRCLRTGDIDEVGDDTHLTFFEMLGNWSLGDYWKNESIEWSFEFLTKELAIPLERLAVSCFAGDENAPIDKESAKIWESLGVSQERIVFLPKEDNWWGPVGETGPCGPDTEIFYWKSNDVLPPEHFDPTDKNWVEIWNNVFMQYVKNQEGKYVLAEQKNVDTGMGFERTLAILNGCDNVYETDLFLPLIALLPIELDKKRKRVIADHVRAIAFLISDGVIPSNKNQGYVLRRLMRRVLINNEVDFEGLFQEVARQYPALQLGQIWSVFETEKNDFATALTEGLKYLGKIENPSTKDAFLLYQTYGLPVEIIKEKITTFNEKEFEEELKKHQELSRTASAGMFKGGLADHETPTIKLHTAHHLLLAGLQQILGKDVTQKGSNITQERLRIDVSFERKITKEELQQVEDLVNEKIKAELEVVKKEMPLQEAEKIGAQMEFGVKYGNTVSVYFIENKDGSPFSKEFCGGPHVHNTRELGTFKIIKEEASSQGVRRIKAIVE